MTFPPVDEPSQQRRAAVYGRANQASTHYRPLRKGRPSTDPGPAPTGRAAKAANRRRFVLFVVALLVAVALGTTIFGVVLASPAPVAQAPGPAREMAEPATQPPPPTGRGTATELTPPSTGTSGAPENTTAPRRESTTKPAAGVGGKDSRPATTATFTYQNCNKARKAGAAPLHPGDPGYSDKLDKDGNGIACDEKEEKGKG